MINDLIAKNKRNSLFEEVWSKILKEEGKVFRQIRGGEFVYSVKGGLLSLDRTNRNISKNTIKEALVYVPLENTVPLQNLQAPSYLYAILMDARIRDGLW